MKKKKKIYIYIYVVLDARFSFYSSFAVVSLPLNHPEFTVAGDHSLSFSDKFKNLRENNGLESIFSITSHPHRISMFLQLYYIMTGSYTLF